MRKPANRSPARALAPALALLLVLALPAPLIACGFHAAYFTGDFHEDWQRLKPRLDKVSPATSFVNGRPVLRGEPMRDGVVRELLRILRYVDTYNDAPDSPGWMHSEEGREHARACAATILQELGAAAAPAVWEALADEIRFATEERRKTLAAIRARRDEQQAAFFKYRESAKRFPELKAALEPAPPSREDRVLAAWVDAMNLAGVPYEGMPRVAVQGADGKAHRAVPANRRTGAFPYGLLGGDQRVFQLVAMHPRAASDPDLRLLLAEYQKQAQELAGEVLRFNTRYPAPGAGMGNVGSDMLPADEFRADLEQVLVNMGQGALEVLKQNLRHRNLEAAKTAQRLAALVEAQPVPPPLRDLRLAENEDRLLGRLAVEVWDADDPVPDSLIAARALGELKARGKDAWPKLIELMKFEKLNLRNECARALVKLTQQQLGDDPAAWEAWHKRAVLQQPLDIAENPEFEERPRPDVSTEAGGELLIGRREGAAAPAAKTPAPPLEEEEEDQAEP
ncbi:MAG: hypothetical protein M5U26_27505 [Planctomycetota bacterium]|nr:hypothetical protein [Planctomycetota bacterium]